MITYLIIPCFNEEARLNVNEFIEYSDKNKLIKFIFANDGSSDGTLDILKKLNETNSDKFLIYNAPKNQGKAEVIRSAFQKFNNLNLFSDTDWIGYWDADLATPLWEVENMFIYAKTYKNHIDAIWGSRLLRLGGNIQRSAMRHYLGRVFATVVGNVLKIKSYDSQCGAKLFSYPSSKIAFSEPFISKWIFDVEILLRLKNKHLIEYPLRQWNDIPGSKMKIFREIIRVLKDIYKIKKKYRVS